MARDTLRCCQLLRQGDGVVAPAVLLPLVVLPSSVLVPSAWGEAPTTLGAKPGWAG